MNNTNIERGKYFDYILPFIHKFGLIKILVGQRRVGKSYIMLQIIDHIMGLGVKSEEVIYINKEELKRDYIKDYKELHKAIKNYKYIFVDEIQNIDERQKAIVDLQKDGDKDIYITGSNANLLSSELSTLLGGRYKKINIYPLVYNEFLIFHNQKDSQESFLKYLQYGGLPYIKNLGLNKSANEYLKDVIDTIVLKDVVRRRNIRNSSFYYNLITFIAQNIGTIFSAKSISDYLISQKIKVSINIILEYIKYSTQAMFISQVNRFDIKGKKVFELKQKFYFTDIGIRNAMCGFNELDFSQILENVVYNHLVANGREVYIGEIDGKEIDFVAQKVDENKKKMYIQVCHTINKESTQKREFENLLSIQDNRTKYLLVYEKVGPDFQYEGINYMTIKDFCSKEI